MKQSRVFSAGYIAIAMLLSLAILAIVCITDSIAESVFRLPSVKFGRKHPFMPLVPAKPVRSMEPASADSDPVQPKAETDNSDEKPTIRLMAVLIFSGAKTGKPVAIIEENGINRSIHVGDTVAEMEVVKICKGEVGLKKDDEVYRLKLEGMEKQWSGEEKANGSIKAKDNDEVKDAGNSA